MACREPRLSAEGVTLAPPVRVNPYDPSFIKREVWDHKGLSSRPWRDASRYPKGGA